MTSIYSSPAAVTVAVALNESIDSAKQILSDMENFTPKQEILGGVNTTAEDGTKVRLYRAEGETFLMVIDTDEATATEVEFID